MTPGCNWMLQLHLYSIELRKISVASPAVGALKKSVQSLLGAPVIISLLLDDAFRIIFLTGA